MGINPDAESGWEGGGGRPEVILLETLREESLDEIFGVVRSVAQTSHEGVERIRMSTAPAPTARSPTQSQSFMRAVTGQGRSGAAAARGGKSTVVTKPLLAMLMPALFSTASIHRRRSEGSCTHRTETVAPRTDSLGGNCQALGEASNCVALRGIKTTFM